MRLIKCDDAGPQVSEDTQLLVEAYRPELVAHCYRMMGSIHEAEDLVQETMLRAWRAADRYDPARGSLRTWLYRIATNACLTALKSRVRRPLPAGLVGPSDDPQAPLVAGQEVAWLQPFPDVRWGDPAEAVASKDSVRLAFIAALQLLPARQRAILVLREVLQWPASDVAAALQMTVAAVNSGLQRARARLAASELSEDALTEPDERTRRDTLDRYVQAFLRADVAALAHLLTDDVVLEMPPVLNWYVGRKHYAGFMSRVFATRGTRWRVFALSANGQPALAAYAQGDDGLYHAHTLQVFSVSTAGISHNVVFADTTLFPAFGLPPTAGDHPSNVV